jgi:acyl-coenzyme A synthetase/AMP-(fatty) acid ligase/pimeloyl-ACP methyl ester carboxylesterase
VTDSLLIAPAPGIEFDSMPGLESTWSQTVAVLDTDGVPRTWHVLDNGVSAAEGTLLCVHGNPTWSYLWRRFLANAEPAWRVVAVDQLGMGYSERLGRPRTLAERIDDLDSITKALAITGRVVVAGHDWGGPISLGWVERHRDQVAGVILANTGVSLPADARPWLLVPLVCSRLLRELACVRTTIFVRGAARLTRAELPDRVRAALRAPYSSAERRRAVGDFVADIPLSPSHPSRDALDRIVVGLADLGDLPALLLWGPRDPVFSPAVLRDLESRLPQADVHRYAGASHLVTEDVPEAAAHAWFWIRTRVCGPTPLPNARPQSPAIDVEAGDGRATAIAEPGHDHARLTTFDELNQRVDALVDTLRRAGVKPGDRVAVLVPPGLELTSAVYACWRAGATIVVADTGLGWRRMAEALRSADPDHLVGVPAAVMAAAAMRIPGGRIVLGDPREKDRARLTRVSDPQTRTILSPKRQEPTTDPEAAVLFTSGATGPPKGVVYRHSHLRAQLELVRAVCGMTPDDRLVAAFAPFALYGPALGIAAAVPRMDVTRPGSLTAAALADAAASIGATLVFASPAALRNVVATAGQLAADHYSALARIRLVLSAGAPVGIPLLRRVQELLPTAQLHTPYGMTEVLPVTDIDLPELERAGSGNGVCVGRPLPGVRLGMSRLDGLGRADGPPLNSIEVTGEICVSAAHVKDRYDRLWATEHASSRDAGWHRTGDVGHLDAAGRLWVEGRLAHVISTADGPLTPVGTEQRIEAHTPVTAAALVGVGPRGTQQPVAVVVPQARRRRGLADDELARAVRAAADVRLAAILTVPSLPVDIRHAAKIDRSRLARWAERVLSGGRVGRP